MVYNVAIPDEPIDLDVRVDAVTVWKGPVGTKVGGPNHVRLVLRNGKVVTRVVHVNEAWLGTPERSFRLPPYDWKQPDDHVRFEPRSRR